MKFGWTMGVVCAVGAHLGFLLFGGLLFLDDEEEHATLQEVQLISEAEAEEEKEEQPPEETSEPADVLEDEEPPPDAADVVRSIELSAAASMQKLEAASLSAIEAALSGRGGASDAGDALSFASGGRIGGLASADSFEKKLEEAFTLGEIDQKPRAVFQTAPLYPAEMRGRKVEGLVTLIFVVDASGRVTLPKVESSSHKAFEKPALDAVKQWKFEPAVKGGQRVACKMRAPIRFQPS